MLPRVIQCCWTFILQDLQENILSILHWGPYWNGFVCHKVSHESVNRCWVTGIRFPQSFIYWFDLREMKAICFLSLHLTSLDVVAHLQIKVYGYFYIYLYWYHKWNLWLIQTDTKIKKLANKRMFDRKSTNGVLFSNFRYYEVRLQIGHWIWIEKSICNSTEQNPSWKANSRSTNKEISRLLWKLIHESATVHCLEPDESNPDS